jgi:hypothetical protein
MSLYTNTNLERFCRWKALLPRQFAVRNVLASDLRQNPLESLAIVDGSLFAVAIIKAEYLLIKIAEQVKWFHTNVRSRQAALEETPEIFHSIRMYAALYILHRVVNDLVLVLTRKTLITRQFIGEQFCPSVDVVFNDLLHRHAETVRNYLSTNTPAALQHSHDDDFTFMASLSGNLALSDIVVHVTRLPADERFVCFDLFAICSELHKGVVGHSTANAVHHEPRGFLRDSNGAMDFPRTNSIAAVRNHPHGQHPLSKREPGILEDRADFDGELLPALPALPAFLRGKVVVLFVFARGTSGLAIGPAHHGHSVYAVLFITEKYDGLLKGSKVGNGHGFSPLVFMRGKPDNGFEIGIAAHSAMLVKPRFSVSAESGAFVDLMAPEGFQPSISPFTKGVTTCEWAEPQERGIHRLAPLDALLLATPWWASHWFSPFKWIGLLKSFGIFVYKLSYTLLGSQPFRFTITGCKSGDHKVVDRRLSQFVTTAKGYIPNRFNNLLFGKSSKDRVDTCKKIFVVIRLETGTYEYVSNAGCCDVLRSGKPGECASNSLRQLRHRVISGICVTTQGSKTGQYLPKLQQSGFNALLLFLQLKRFCQCCEFGPLIFFTAHKPNLKNETGRSLYKYEEKCK